MANRISNVLNSVAACLCAEIADSNLPSPCFCGVVAGEGVAWDQSGECDNENGMAWVRLTSAYPSEFVGRAVEGVGNCHATLFGFDIEVGIMRAIPMEGAIPDAAEHLAASDLQLDDMLAMRRAIDCCGELSPKDYIVGQYRPVGPLGLMVGGTWTVFVSI